jgi:D-sedoheptulose 7-phosphate isomerase
MEGDILLAISTSGDSANVLLAVEAAKNLEIFTVGLTGGDGGKLATLADLALVVKSDTTPRIQETHMLVGHIICQLVDYLLFQQGVPDE